MNSKEFLSEDSSWNISQGDELANPRSRELAKVINIRDYNLTDKKQKNELKKIMNSYSNNIISLNDDHNSSYAHIVEIQIIAAEYAPRQNMKLMYIYHDNKPTKTWSSYSGVSGREVNLNTKRGRDRLRNILRQNLLPITKRSDGGDLNAGNHWQKVDISTRASKSRDRIKPNEIGAIYNKNQSWWDQHPEIRNLINSYKAKIDATKDQTTKNDLRREFERLRSDIINRVPHIQMMNHQRDEKDVQKPLRANDISTLINKARARNSGPNFLRSFFPKRKKEYLSALLNKFIDKPNSPGQLYPFKIIDNSQSRAMMTGSGIGTDSSIATDFMEVVHPVAVITGNYLGSARNYILNHLGVRSYEELIKNAAISYGSNNTGKLIDSAIYTKKGNQVKKVQISSKEGKGSPASAKSLQVAYDEVMRNSVSKKLWETEIEPLENDDDYQQSLTLIKLFTNSKTQSWEDAVQAGLTFNLITKEDVKLINNLAAQIKTKNDVDKTKNDIDDEEDEETTKKTKKVEIPTATFERFSDELKDSFNDSPYRGTNQFTKLISGIWNEVIKDVNESEAFGNLVVWLFNHSATIQVNTVVNRNQSDNSVSIVHIIGTWPTTLVETAKLTIGQQAGEAIRFDLIVNGYKQTIGTTPPNLSNKYPLPKKPDSYSKVADPYSKKLRQSDLASQRRIKYTSLNLPPVNANQTTNKVSAAPAHQNDLLNFLNDYNINNLTNLAKFGSDIIKNDPSTFKDKNRNSIDKSMNAFNAMLKENQAYINLLDKKAREIWNKQSKSITETLRLEDNHNANVINALFWTYHLYSLKNNNSSPAAISIAADNVKNYFSLLFGQFVASGYKPKFENYFPSQANRGRPIKYKTITLAKPRQNDKKFNSFLQTAKDILKNKYEVKVENNQVKMTASDLIWFERDINKEGKKLVPKSVRKRDTSKTREKAFRFQDIIVSSNSTDTSAKMTNESNILRGIFLVDSY
jgi:hypothetical protein